MTTTDHVPTERDLSRQAASRRARFRRDDPQPIRLTSDDIAVIRHVARHRFLRATHLLRLLEGRSPKKLLERLGALYHNGYLDRPRAQLHQRPIRNWRCRLLGEERKHLLVLRFSQFHPEAVADNTRQATEGALKNHLKRARCVTTLGSVKVSP